MHASFESTYSDERSPVRHASAPLARVNGRAPVAEPEHEHTWKEQVVRLLKDSLIKELVCVVRYNNLSGDVQTQPLISAEFLLHAYEELAHAHRLAQRIAQLGGELEYSPNLLLRMGQATHQQHRDLQSMIQANLSSEYRAITQYTEIMSQLDAEDVATRRLLQEIVDEERAHAEELKLWLVN
ncbi:MAG: ferritin-like domain-containing protein [Hylemonella sp.]|nr:ferritin-like domain-containing protein [Hylemonella sp.]